MKKDLLRIRITARQMVRYDQTVLMTETQWHQFKQLDGRTAAAEVQELLNLNDVYDSNDIDPDDFEAEVVGPDNKPVQPADRYR